MAIRVPDSVAGPFVWEGESYGLKAGENTLDLLVYQFV